MTVGGPQIFRGLARAECAGLLALADAYRRYVALSLGCVETLVTIMLDGARDGRPDEPSPWTAAGDDAYRVCRDHVAQLAAIPRLSCFSFLDHLDRLRESSRSAVAKSSQSGAGVGPGK